MNKPPLLFVCKFLPYPPRSGAALRNWAIIRKLSKHYQITLAAFRHPYWQVDSSVISQYVHEVIETVWQPKPYLIIARETLKGKPYSVARFYDPVLRQKIESWQHKNSCVRVHVSELAPAILLPENSLINVYDAHNIEAHLWGKLAGNSPFWVWVGWQLERDRIAQFEQSVINKSEKVTCVSQEDFETITDYCKNKPIIILPNGTNIAEVASNSGSNFNLLFVGQTGWHANDYSLQWFIQSVWIKIKNKLPQTELALVGGKAKKRLNRLVESYEGIQLHENVNSVEPYFQWASAAIAPLLYGGGTSLKILEYAAHKLPIVCTSAAIRGLPFDSQSVWICNTADDFVESLNEIWSNSNQVSKKVDRSFAIVKNCFDWDITLKQLIGNDENSFAHPFPTK